VERDARRRRGDPSRRIRRIVRLLEASYGVPKASRDRDLVGSLVQTVLSQHTTDAASDAAFAALRRRFGSWEAVSSADARSVEATIRGAGLARRKARTINGALARLARERKRIDLSFLTRMPTEEVQRYLTGYDGVGAKTAACVLLFGLGREVVPVDTHVHRVVGRLGVVGRQRTREATFEALSGVVPRGKALSLHVNLVRHGRSVCRAGRPRCRECTLSESCDFGAASAGGSDSLGSER